MDNDRENHINEDHSYLDEESIFKDQLKNLFKRIPNPYIILHLVCDHAEKPLYIANKLSKIFSTRCG